MTFKCSAGRGRAEIRIYESTNLQSANNLPMLQSAKSSNGASESKARSELKHPRAPGTGDPAEVRVVHVRLGIVVILPVQYVEGFGSNLQPRAGAERKALGERRVHIEVARTAYHIVDVGARPKCGIGHRTHRDSDEARCVEIIASAGTAAILPIRNHQIDARIDIGPAVAYS